MKNYYKIIGLCSLTLALASCGSKYAMEEVSVANKFCSCYADPAGQTVDLANWHAENYEELSKMYKEVEDLKNVDYSESELIEKGLEMIEDEAYAFEVAKSVCYDGYVKAKDYSGSQDEAIFKKTCPEVVYALGLRSDIETEAGKLLKMKDYTYVAPSSSN